MSDIEFDRFFKELHLKTEVDNYIYNNELPKYYKKTSYQEYITLKQQCPEISENIENIIPYDNNYNNILSDINETISKCNETIKVMTLSNTLSDINETISKCNETIKVMTLSEQEVDTCPICITEFEETNYVIPKCGHKVCAVCFTNNIKYNKHTGDCCVLCRKRIC
jgi:hypothetical protein